MMKKTTVLVVRWRNYPCAILNVQYRDVTQKRGILVCHISWESRLVFG